MSNCGSFDPEEQYEMQEQRKWLAQEVVKRRALERMQWGRNTRSVYAQYSGEMLHVEL